MAWGIVITVEMLTMGDPQPSSVTSSEVGEGSETKWGWVRDHVLLKI
jgi:hypothetical protein